MLSAVLPVPAQEVQGHRGFSGSQFELKRKIVCLQVVNEEGKEQPSQTVPLRAGTFPHNTAGAALSAPPHADGRSAPLLAFPRQR